MNGFILVLPILLIRYGLLNILSKEAVERAAFFPPLEGIERIAQYIYQITVLCLFIGLAFIKIELNRILTVWGLYVCILGMILYTISIINFTRPAKNGFNTNGLYKISRNPMYVAFFLYFLGCSMLASSWLLLAILLILQISVHCIIISEERWCMKVFGNDYRIYMNTVRRYIGIRKRR